jgi:predicted alpha/beta superfamily hydrolase
MARSSDSADRVGTLKHHTDLASRFVEPRNVDVWLPPGYALEDDRRFPVIYMHDGQNLFDPKTASIGVPWGIDRAIVRLTSEGRLREAIVVGIWSTDRRYQEYMPQKALALSGRSSEFAAQAGGEALSDAYLRFIVQELKPFIDRAYRTQPERGSTLVMGSSMGGLISLYALCEYPQSFGGAGCLSTHWPAGEGIVIEYLRRALPRPAAHRIYFDHGTETLDASYEPFQRQVDEVMRGAGYREGVDWITRRFPGAEHSERAWRERVHIPLLFLLEGQSA